jgi:hypothetical protein
MKATTFGVILREIVAPGAVNAIIIKTKAPPGVIDAAGITGPPENHKTGGCMGSPNLRKKILKREYYRAESCTRRAAGTVILTLECGHIVTRKISKEPKGDYAKCWFCSHGKKL